MLHEYRSCNDAKKSVLPNEAQECMNSKKILWYYYHNKSYQNLQKPFCQLMCIIMNKQKKL